MRATVVASVVAVASSFLAAVVQHEVQTGSDPAATIALNLQQYATAAANASSQGASIVVFPEFGIGMNTDACSSPQDSTAFCEPITFTNGTVLCDASSMTPIAAAASCIAKQENIWVSINSCESTAAGNFNTQLIFDSNGAFVTSYRKTHPWFTKCFLAPSTPELVSFTAPFFSQPIGIFTCFDILFSTPGPELVKQGVKHFVYSAAIPLVGSAAQTLWSSMYGATLIGSNLQDGQSGIFANGTRLTPAPASGQATILVAEVW